MDSNHSHRIVGACLQHVWFHDGLRDDPPPSLKEYSLADMVEANRMVAQENDSVPEGNGVKTIQVVCDDRLIAALYVATHYQPENPEDCEPVAVAGTSGVFVLEMKGAYENNCR